MLCLCHDCCIALFNTQYNAENPWVLEDHLVPLSLSGLHNWRGSQRVPGKPAGGPFLKDGGIRSHPNVLPVDADRLRPPTPGEVARRLKAPLPDCYPPGGLLPSHTASHLAAGPTPRC